MEPLSSSSIIDKTVWKGLFSDFPTLMVLHQQFFNGIQSKDLSTILETFIDFSKKKFYSIYIDYCRDQQERLTMLGQEANRIPAFIDHEQHVMKQFKGSQKQTLQQLISSPPQRIQRYPILLKAISSYFPLEHPLKYKLKMTIDSMNQVAKVIDNAAKANSGTKMMFELLSKIGNCPVYRNRGIVFIIIGF